MDVKEYQHHLAGLGYHIGECDGAYGPTTKQSIQKFQGAYGLPQDGVWGPQTEAKLREVIGKDLKPKQPQPKPEPPAFTGSFWDDPKISKYFRKHEWRCRCPRCGGFPAEPAELLVRAAVKVREYFGRPFNISSGVRCVDHNAEVGGVYNSRHLTAHAVDYMISGKSASQVLAFVRTLPEIKYAYAINSQYVHMDIGA